MRTLAELVGYQIFGMASEFDRLRAALRMSFLHRVQPLPLAILPLPTRRIQRSLSPVSADNRQDL
jgi:hypothetical protein